MGKECGFGHGNCGVPRAWVGKSAALMVFTQGCIDYTKFLIDGVVSTNADPIRYAVRLMSFWTTEVAMMAKFQD
jgi:hypothetical protein